MKKMGYLLTGLFFACATWASGEMFSIQVKEAVLRSAPSFLGKPVAEVAYGDRVEQTDVRGDWVRIRTRTGAAGWTHESALTTRRVILSAGHGDAGPAATGDEIALAGRGFSEDVEKAYASEKDLNFSWIDRMEDWQVSDAEKIRFLKTGGLNANDGGSR